MSNKIKGKLGEEIARDFLLKRGFEILDTNFRYSRYGEVDIVAIKSNIVYFIEVKYRTTNAFGMPFEAVTKSKLEKINACARYYLSLCKKKYKAYRISVVSILNEKIDFIENVLF